MSNDIDETTIQAAFDGTAEPLGTAGLGRLATHATAVGGHRASRLRIFQWATGMAVVLVVVVAAVVGVASQEVIVEPVETATRATVAEPKDETAPMSEERFDDEVDVAYGTYLDIGLGADSSDLSLLDGEPEGIDEDEAIRVYDQLLNRGG